MKLLYDQLDVSFAELRDTTKYSEAKYKQKVRDWRKLLDDKFQYIFMALFVILIIGNTILKNITLGSDPNYPNSFQLYPSIAIVNFLFFIIAGIIVGTFMWHLFAIVRIIRDFCSDADNLKLQPFHPDGAAGLQPLTKLTFLMNLICVFAMAIPLWEVIINGKDPLDTTILVYVIIITIITTTVFFFPLLKAHSVMKSTKETILKKLSAEHSVTYEKLLSEMKKEGASINSGTLEHLKGVNELYEMAEKMPVWPFDTNFIIKIVTTIGLPIVMYFYEMILSIF